MLKFRNLMIAHTAILTLLGWAFVGWGSTLLPFYGLSQPPAGEQAPLFWTAASFTRLFGAMLWSLGVLTHNTRNLVQIEA